ncbi:MAG: hypothetical protein IPK50_07440 [Fibrobacterota bacterium]|nr:hypothetical protein [Fibrobacterota bacterium]QQS06726.1 MAG: hypothetical protein IPK50_07440 [Fibrobacterota bacterium]
MKSPLVLAGLSLIAGSAFGSLLQLHGTAVDRQGSPLSGVVVKLASTGDSATTTSDGSWHLARTASIARKSIRARTASQNLSILDGAIHASFSGFTPDGRRQAKVPALEKPASPILARQSTEHADTLSFRWKGVVIRKPLPTDTSRDLGATRLDTSGLNLLEIRASRFSFQNLSGLHLEIVNLDSQPHDSLVIRLHLQGTAAELADFAVRLDFAQAYTAAGFNFPTGLDPRAISPLRPRQAATGCANDQPCPWVFDIPLSTTSFPVLSRLSLDLILQKHLLSGDSTQLLNLAPSHDPFAGADWSFRGHASGTTKVFQGIPELGIDQRQLAPVNPYIQLMRGSSVLYGQGPSEEF